jgi:hypothetical protein
LNGLDPIVLANSKTGLDDLGNEYVPATEPISETKADAAYNAAINWNEDVYAETITSDEEPAVWTDHTLVRVLYVDSPKLMYLCRVVDENDICEILSAVDWAGHTSASLLNSTVGQPCLVFVTNFSQTLYIGGVQGWRRAIIHAVQPSTVPVTLMDFGKVMTVQRCMWSMRRIRRDLCQIPSRVRRLHAPSVVPVGGTTWSVDDKVFIRKFALGRLCTMASVGDVGLSLDNGLDYFLTMEKFGKLSFTEPRMAIVVSPN